MKDVRVGIIGDFNPTFPPHKTTNESISHAARFLSIAVDVEWLPTDLFDTGTEKRLEQFDALWASAGSPYKSMDGMLRAIRFARERNWPFIAT
ncbi:MAG TPA: hypothetical protein VID27_09655 [Blastocatellia bacterium]